MLVNLFAHIPLTGVRRTCLVNFVFAPGVFSGAFKCGTASLIDDWRDVR